MDSYRTYVQLCMCTHMCINIYLCLAEDETHSSAEGGELAAEEAAGVPGHREASAGWAPAPSGVVVGQLEHGASLLQALVHVQPPPERLLLLLQLPADTARAGDRLFFALGMEDGSTTFTPAC